MREPDSDLYLEGAVASGTADGVFAFDSLYPKVGLTASAFYVLVSFSVTEEASLSRKKTFHSFTFTDIEEIFLLSFPQIP